MIALDTNILIRILTGDDVRQQRAAVAFVHANCSNAQPGWINRIVTVEMVWVLERAYNFERAQVADALESLLHTAEFQFEDHDEVRLSLALYRDGANLSDALQEVLNKQKGCSTTITFDRHAAERIEAFTLLHA